MRTNGYLSPVCLCRVIVIGLLLSSVGCNASNGWAMNRSGMRQYQRGQYAQARHRFARAVAHDPYNADYRHNLAMSLQKQGDVAASEKILRHNLTINAMHQPTYHSLAQLMVAQGRAPEAQDLVAGWVATQPYVPEANIEMAWLQRESGDIPGAEQSLQTALKASPGNPIALAHLGQLYQGAGRPDEAVAYYQRSLSANWDQPEVQSRLATLTDQAPPTRSATMQNGTPTPMMASAPMMMDAPMMVSNPEMMGDQMMAANTPVMTGDPMLSDVPTMATLPAAAMAVPFGSDPSAVKLEDVSLNPEPRSRRRRQRNKDNNPTVATYPLPNFGTQQMAWSPSGMVPGQPTLAFQPTSMPMETAMMPQIAPPQMADSISSPYVSNLNGQLIPQADPAHFSESNPEMTASVPTVDPH